MRPAVAHGCGVVPGKSMMGDSVYREPCTLSPHRRKQGKQVSGEEEPQRDPYNLLLLWQIHSPEKQRSLVIQRPSIKSYFTDWNTENLSLNVWFSGHES